MARSSKPEQTRALILAGAGRSFRRQGFGGVGVDGMAKEAGVTSGAFYAHFRSKAEAFRETVEVGMQELETAIRALRAEAPTSWIERFVDFYLGERRTCAAADTCALQSLTGEVARADLETRDAFETRFEAVIAAAAEGMPAADARSRRDQAIVLLTLLSGGVSLARAVNNPELSQEIATAIRASLKSLGTL
ncbi:MAG TPA: TetR/AcrR family transcriptional regulator [Polyangiaceae bacterium]|nr:TetR/AcrR family transcriptional regulator [Polyangiaceae bacterium]